MSKKILVFSIAMLLVGALSVFYQSYKHYSSFKEAINIKGLLT